MDTRLFFNSRGEFRDWLSRNSESEGFWMIFYKGLERKGIRYEEALEEALSYGWIDSLIKKVDDQTYLRKFTPRAKNSPWSEKNKTLAERLIQEGLMTDRGLREIHAAKESGAWNTPRSFFPGEEHIVKLKAALQAHDTAFHNFDRMPPSAQKQFAGFYFDAKKEETRQKRLETIIRLLEVNKKLMG